MRLGKGTGSNAATAYGFLRRFAGTGFAGDVRVLVLFSVVKGCTYGVGQSPYYFSPSACMQYGSNALSEFRPDGILE
jgi:hypothetical protein